MTKIKICGLFRDADIDYVNFAMPDFVGFVIDFPKSSRSITRDCAKAFKSKLNSKIQAVGVFVNADLESIKDIIDEKIINIVQLHGNEDENYIAELRSMIPNVEIWKAFKVSSSEDVETANQSCADRILLDNGQGTGHCFDWSVINTLKRPMILAGGLTPENIQIAVSRLHPWAVDISSGVESSGIKNKDKIIAAVNALKVK